MGNGTTKDIQNVYFRARKEAAVYNERLCSRESASEMLGVSPSTLADYELGITKVVPVDKVVLMADLYNCPELRTGYCKHECPIGKHMSVATEAGSIEGIALRLIKELDTDSLKKMKYEMVTICADGVISKDEIPALKKLLKQLDSMSVAISELKLAGEKILKGGHVGDG